MDAQLACAHTNYIVDVRSRGDRSTRAPQAVHASTWQIIFCTSWARGLYHTPHRIFKGWYLTASCELLWIIGNLTSQYDLAHNFFELRKFVISKHGHKHLSLTWFVAYAAGESFSSYDAYGFVRRWDVRCIISSSSWGHDPLSIDFWGDLKVNCSITLQTLHAV